MRELLRPRAREARAEIATGALRCAPIRDLLLSIPWDERDAFVDEMLGIEEAPPDVPDLPRGAVPYLASGVDEILVAIDEAPITERDELVDIGSGLGRVALLVHLITGARARGIEIQAPLVQRSIATRSTLGLTNVSFLHANAADVELDGSAFYLYAPVNGSMLTNVCKQLERVARARRILICAVGLSLGHVSWLAARSTSNASLTIYESR